MNLHVGRNFPGLPEGPGISFDKGLDHFMPQMIEMQHEYARDLLMHVNPYTGKSYADEPAVALIEISNEDGLIQEWSWGRPPRAAALLSGRARPAMERLAQGAVRQRRRAQG